MNVKEYIRYPKAFLVITVIAVIFYSILFLPDSSTPDVVDTQETYALEGGGKYVGALKDNRPEGKGSITLADGGISTGEFKHGV